MSQGPDELLSRGVLRRTPQTPRSLRGSESRSARRPLPPVFLLLVLAGGLAACARPPAPRVPEGEEYVFPSAEPRELTPEEARIWLRVGRSTIYDLLKRGELPSIRFGRAVRIPRQALQRYVSEGFDRVDMKQSLQVSENGKKKVEQV